MKYRRGPAIFGCTTLAMAAALAMATPNIGWAGQLTVTEQLPNTGFTQTDILGGSANVALTPGSSYSGPLPTITTPDGRFEFIFSNVSAADPNGFPTLSGSMTVVNLMGGQGSLFMDFKQAFVPNPIFNNGCFDGVGLSRDLHRNGGPREQRLRRGHHRRRGLASRRGERHQWRGVQRRYRRITSCHPRRSSRAR